jgi:hypothetical protein
MSRGRRRAKSVNRNRAATVAIVAATIVAAAAAAATLAGFLLRVRRRRDVDTSAGGAAAAAAATSFAVSGLAVADFLATASSAGLLLRLVENVLRHLHRLRVRRRVLELELSFGCNALAKQIQIADFQLSQWVRRRVRVQAVLVRLQLALLLEVALHNSDASADAVRRRLAVRTSQRERGGGRRAVHQRTCCNTYSRTVQVPWQVFIFVRLALALGNDGNGGVWR